MEILIKRIYKEKQTEGLWEIWDENNCIYNCKVLERPWLNNERNVSCIPEGTYKVTREVQEKRGKVLRLHNIPNRDGVLVHSGNYVSHSKGCLLPGKAFAYINKDNLLDVTSSKNTVNEIYDILPDKCTIIIKS